MAINMRIVGKEHASIPRTLRLLRHLLHYLNHSWIQSRSRSKVSGVTGGVPNQLDPSLLPYWMSSMDVHGIDQRFTVATTSGVGPAVPALGPTGESEKNATPELRFCTMRS